MLELIDSLVHHLLWRAVLQSSQEIIKFPKSYNYESVSPRESNVSLEEYGVRLEENISYGQITNSQ